MQTLLHLPRTYWFVPLLALLMAATPPEEDPNDPTARCYIVGQSKGKILDLLAASDPDMCYEDFILHVLPHFEGVRYGGGGAGCPASKTLVNCEQMDCVTFVETVLAMALAHQDGRPLRGHVQRDKYFERFVHHLNNTRYYAGKNEGWGNRILYLTDAMRQLVQMGVLQDVGPQAGTRIAKPINYISSHPNKFRGVNMTRMREIERSMTQAERYYYPLDRIATDYAPLAHNGDIAALATTVKGLDVSHVGFITIHNDRLHFTHASSTRKSVVLQEDFLKYLDTRTTITGIYVYRPVQI